jgi:hypothetical protein
MREQGDRREAGIEGRRDADDVARLPVHERGRSVLEDLDGKAGEPLPEKPDDRTLPQGHRVNSNGIEKEIDKRGAHK